MAASLYGVRVVCFYPWAPFEPTGAWSRFSSLWKFLLNQGAQVTLAFLDRGNNAQLRNITVRYIGEFNIVNNIGAFAQKVASAEAKSELKSYSSKELNFLLMYEKGLYLNNPKTGLWLDEVIRDQDVVTCDYPMFAPFLSDFCKKWGKPLIVTSHDMLFELHGVHPGAKERLKQKEIQALELADARVFCNDAERDYFETLGLNGVTVLNTGDALSLIPGQEEESRNAVRATLKFKSTHYTLFVGSAHGPNHEAVTELRRIAKAVPETTFIVAGNCCPKGAEGNFIATGPISDQYLDTLYRGASLVLVPLLKGTGMSLKVFQAFSYAKAVISTPIGARGYTVTSDHELVLVSTPLEFPAAIRRLLSDAPLRQRITENAREYALRLDYRTQFQPYSEIICRLLQRAPSSVPQERPALIVVDNNLSDRIGHHFNYTLSLKEECSAQGIPFASLIKKSSAPDVISALGGEAAFSFGIHEDSTLNPYPPDWGGLHSTYDFLLSNDHFAKELEAGLGRKATCSDVIFVPNATHRQILGVALLLRKNPIYQTLRFVLLLRYSVHAASGPITERKSTLDKETAERYALAIEKLQVADQAGMVRLATDSATLAKEFGAYSKRPLEVLPIPHTSQSASTSPSDDIPPKALQKVRVVYLGDARDEKGFELLPAVVRAFARVDLSARVEFVLQGFISSLYHLRMAYVIDELIKLNLPNVHLIRNALSADSYRALLESADLVALPYDALTYRARTSGPFVEAICAGKPVIVPQQSWMSTQLGESRAGETFISGNAQDLVRAVLAAVSNISVHTEAANELGKRFREYHNPTSFIKQLMKIS